MEIHTQVPDKVTRDALRRLSDWLDHDEDQGDEGRAMNRRCGQRCCTLWPPYAACKRPVPRSEPAVHLGALEGIRTPNLLIVEIYSRARYLLTSSADPLKYSSTARSNWRR